MNIKWQVHLQTNRHLGGDLASHTHGPSFLQALGGHLIRAGPKSPGNLEGKQKCSLQYTPL